MSDGQLIPDKICTYTASSRRKRTSALRGVEVLEKDVLRAEALLAMLLPDLDINEFDLDEVLWNPSVSRRRQQKGIVYNTQLAALIMMKHIDLTVHTIERGPAECAVERDFEVDFRRNM